MSEKKKNNFILVLRSYWPFIRAERTMFFLMTLVYSAGAILATAVVPVVYCEIIDVLDLAGDRSELWQSLLQFIFILLLLQLSFNTFYRIGDYLLVRFQSRIMERLENSVLAHLQKKSFQFFADNFSGSLVSKHNRYFNAFWKLHDIFLFQFWFIAVEFIAISIIVFSTHSLMSLLFIVWGVFYTFISIYLSKKEFHLRVDEIQQESLVTGRLADILTNIFAVKTFATLDYEYNSFAQATHRKKEYRDRSWHFSNKVRFIKAIISIILEVGGMYFALRLWKDNVISTGTVVLFQTYIAIVSVKMWNLSKAISEFVRVNSDAVEMADILSREIMIKDPVKPEKLAIKKGAIQIQNVNFYYENNEKLFDHFSLEIPAGQRLAIVGESGAGKSTLVKLLLRFTDIQSGDIHIDGQSIYAITQDDLRRSIAYVPQDPVLFHRSLRDNIAYGNRNASEKDIIQAAKKAKAHDFIMKLPQGYKTLVGERGVKLSGGERQRIAIARAILKSAPILILDEATSSLDSVTEQYIQSTLDAVMKDRTVIVIAHRLSTIRKMGRIIVLKDGRIVEDGTHTSLMSQGNYYQKLWNHQSDGFL